MNFIENLLNFAFPTRMIKNQYHRKKFILQERQVYITVQSIAFGFAALAMIGHYFFFDIPMELKPESLWFNYRFGIAGLCCATIAYYSFFGKNKFIPLKFPAILVSLTICYFQTRTMLWYAEVPYLYSFIILIITAFCLRLTPFQNALYVTLSFTTMQTVFVHTAIDNTHVWSAYIVTLIVSTILSSLVYFQAKLFLATETLMDEQRKSLEQNKEFTRILQSFLPRKISLRLESKINNSGLSIENAMHEVLDPKSVEISCLSCDIRGYTQASKKNHQYICDSVIPLATHESVIVENNQGIPRKIGDLLFCYYDSPIFEDNILNAVITGIEIALLEEKTNQEKSSDNQIRKQILISAGQAYVGNIGGESSAIEITAMGTPVNFLNRLEMVVKTPQYLREIPRNHIILSEHVVDRLKSLKINNQFEFYDLRNSDLKIKDFPEVSGFYSIEASRMIHNTLVSILDKKYENSDWKNVA